MSHITRKLILLPICYKYFCTKHTCQWTGTYMYNLCWQKIINMFSAVQNERDRISSRRPSYEEQASGNGLSCASLLNAEMLSRQVGAALEVWKYFEHRRVTSIWTQTCKSDCIRTHTDVICPFGQCVFERNINNMNTAKFL